MEDGGQAAAFVDILDQQAQRLRTDADRDRGARCTALEELEKHQVLVRIVPAVDTASFSALASSRRARRSATIRL